MDNEVLSLIILGGSKIISDFIRYRPLTTGTTPQPASSLRIIAESPWEDETVKRGVSTADTIKYQKDQLVKQITLMEMHLTQGCKISGVAEKGKMLTNVAPETDIHLIDVTSDEGFPEIEKEQLTGVPMAKFEGQTCKMQIDEESKTLIIDCPQEAPKDAPPASAEVSSSPPEAPADNKSASS